MDYEKFKLDRGWKFKTEETLKAAFQRLQKSHDGSILTQEEFLLEAEKPDSEKAKEVYRALFTLWKEGKITSAGVYQFARFKWCLDAPEAIVVYQKDSKEWLVNNCGTKISEAEARKAVFTEFGFTENAIRIIGTPYYDASDWNFIRFDCRAWSWLMKNGEIYSVYSEGEKS